MDKTRMGKRVASLLLSLVMMLSLLPTAAYATMADGVDTQGAIVSENGTDVSDDSNSSGNTDDLQVGGSSGSGTADDTTGAEGGADPTDSVNGNDSADPQDDGDAVLPTAANVVSTSEELVAAIAAASDGDTITLGEGEFTTVGNTSPKKSLTFEGAGTNTVWTIGDLKHAPGGENNGDHSFDGCETITFKNMTLNADNENYRGFIRINNTVVENCTLKGRTAYWGYETAKFVNSTFNAPEGDYALWDYSTKAMTFEGCRFNISGKGVNVYVEAGNAGEATRTVEVNNCTVNSDKANKAFLNIKNSTQAYDVTLSGTNTVTGLEANGTTGSALYQVETTEVTETTGKPVAVKAKADDGTVTTLYEVKETVEASVAEVNGAKYKSLQAAVDAAKSGATVTLLADTRENVTVSKNAIVLDLNGHTLNGGTENAKPALTVDNKKVTLKDSSEAQTGTIKREDTADTKTSHYVIDIQGKNGFMIVESGKVENNSGIPGVKGSSLIRLGNDSVSGWPTLTIKGGTFTQDNFIAIKVDRGTLHLLGGTVNSANSFAIENWNNAYIKGGTVNGTVSTWVYSTGAAFSKLEISGGTVNGNVASVNYDNAADKQARVYVTGGTVTGTLGTYTYNNGLVAMDETAKATIEVTGGTFSKDPTQYVVEDSAISKNDDGTYGVAKTYLAKIGDTEYYTMDEAFHAVKAGETIVMLRDYTTNKVQNSGDESFTIDLGGHTWTANIVDTASAAFEINYSDVTLTVKNGKVVSSQLAGLIPSAMSGTITYNNSKLVFDGVEMTANGHSGIETNGSNTNDTVTLKNSTLNVPNGYGIYFPSSGTLTIDNSVINAKTMGVQVCSGSLNISGAGTAITVTGDGIAKTENDGAIEDGAAISIVERTGYKGLIAIKVESGTFTAKAGNDAVKAYKWDNTNKTESAFDNSKNVVAISGGTFSSEVDKSLCADGFIPTKNEDGTYGVKEGQYVAEVGSTKYATLQAAIDAATEKATVILLADTRENVTISTNRLTLDLNGHTLNGGTVKGKPALTVRARNVIVKDSSEAKTGTIMREDTAENSGVSSHYVIDIQGKNAFLKFESGNVKNDSGNKNGKGASLVRVGDDSVSAWPQLTIAGGTFTQDNFIVIKVDRGTFYLTGGTLNSTDSYAVENWYTATIKGGTVNGTVAAWTYSGGHNSDLTISGGTVNGNVASVSYDKTEGKLAKVSITGGTVTGTLGTYTYGNGLIPINDATKATIAVTGGTFKEDPTKYVVEDSGVTKNTDGTYGVAKAYLAKVGDTSYYTMEEAFKAQTASGKDIVLLRDYTTGSTFNSGSINRTVDLADHTWTCTGTDANSAAFEINYPNATLTVKNGKVVSSQLVGLIPSAMGGTIKYDNSSLEFDGVVMTTTARSGIETNGNNTNDTVTLRNSTLNVPNGFGIYFPSSGTLTIDNSVINAQTMGVQVCSGSLNISGAGTAITVSGDGIDKTINDGAIEDGAAISIVNRAGYKGLDEIKVEGGKFTAKGDNAAVKAYSWENQTASAFDNSENVVAISGGTFSSVVDKSLCADGYIPTQNADGTYGVKEGADGYVEDENGNVTISTAEGLFYFAKKVNAGNNFAGKTVTLANNIDLNDEKWTPIGSFNDATTQFKGTFDGQNHAVTGLKVEESNKQGVGFFGKVYTGTIKNLTVEGSVSASNCNYVGGIVGHGYATITNCTFKGTVGNNNSMQVGGIAGSGGFTVTNCSVYADVTAECWAGGIVGNCQDGGAYTNCYVDGVISAERTYWGGGAAGITPVPLYPSQVISGCYSNTVVKVAGEEVNCPIIAAYNNPLDYNGYSGGLKIYDNSWNKQKNSNDSYPIYAEKDKVGGVLMEGMTAARDNSLIMLEDDLNYVTGDLSKVRIMAGSSVTQAQIDALAVASVGDSKYKSLTEAIGAAEDGQTVTLLADAAEDVVISKSITLDLGGKTLTNTNAGKATISVTGGTVTVKNGNVMGGTGYYNIEVTKEGSNANLTLTDVTATAGNTGSSMIDNWGTLTITSGTYNGGLNVVKSEEGSKLTITGGTFTLDYAPSSGYTAVILVYGDTTISGGEFIQTATPKWGYPQVVMTGVVEGYTAITRVTGGHFVNKKSGDNIFHGLGKATSDNFKVSGGTFNKSIPESYCADGFIPTKNADGTYGVKEGQYVAKVGSKKYETLADAIRLAAKGRTVTLLADVEQNTQLTIGKSITLDLNGKTIRNTKDIWGDNANAILSIKNGAKVTITGNGTIDAKENDCYTINVAKGDLTIENGTFYGNVSVVQVEEGTLSIKGGTFDLHQKWEGSSKYLFNCIDSEFTSGNAKVAISGGTFVGFDPNVSPEQKVDGKTPSFAAPGVGITRNENGSFTAAAGMTAQILDKDGNSVKAYSTLADAVAAAQDGQTVRLLADVAESSIKVNANITIDLNKMTVTGSFVTYGEVTIQNGTIDVPDGKTNYAYGKLTLADVDITGKAASSSLLSVNYNGSVTIDKNSTIVADSAKGDYPAVFIKGQDDSGKTYAPELNIYGTVQSAKTPAIQGNGTDRGVSHVNVFEGAVVKSESLAVYLPQPCEVNITGGLVEGYCGIGIKSGTLNISGGTVRGVANDNVIGDEYSQTNGISYDGSAIMIDSYIGYAGQVQINISGNAVVESKYSTAIREIGNDKSQTNLVGLDITGGTVLGAKDTDAVLVRDVTAKDVNISGGEFSSIVKKEYCAPGFTPVTTANSEGRYGVEIGKFTVKVTSRTTGSDSPVANVAGGGSDITYAEGITVTASAISGYNFVGWFVNEYTGTPYSTNLTCEVKPTDDWTMIAVYEPISGGKFWLTVTASEFTVNGGAVQDSYLYEQFAVGASVTVNFTGSENFLYWVNASNKVVSTEKSYAFIMGSETTLKAVYGKARQNQATVVFISHSDQIISSKAYTTSDTIQFPVPPIKMGCTFTGWSMTEAEIRAAMANNSGIIQVRARYTEPSIACTVTVVYPEGTDNQVVNAVVGKAIDVTAKDIEGKTFSYWTDDKGTVLGYTKTLKLAPSGDMTVKAVYDQAAEAKPVITMSEVSATTANESYVVTFMATRAVPNGYKVVKQGILWSRDAVCGEDGAAAYMQFDSNGKLPDGVRAYIGNNLDLNGVTRYDITTKYNDRTFYGRGYMVLESDAGKLLYIYTDTIASGSYDSLTK